MRDYYGGRERWQSNPKGPPPQPPSKHAYDDLAQRLNTAAAGAGGRSASPSPSSIRVDELQGETQPIVKPLAKGAAGPIHDSSSGGAVKSLGKASPMPTSTKRGGVPPHSNLCDSHFPHGDQARNDNASGHSSSPSARDLAAVPNSPSRGGSSAASSSGSTYVPFIATSLRELREHFALDGSLAPNQSLETRHLGSMLGSFEHASGKKQFCDSA